jgi:hypothetical protein
VSSITLLISHILSQALENPPDWARFRSRLIRRGNILELSVSLHSPFTQLLSTEVQKFRTKARVVATKDIKDADIRSKLRECSFATFLLGSVCDLGSGGGAFTVP